MRLTLIALLAMTVLGSVTAARAARPEPAEKAGAEEEPLVEILSATKHPIPLLRAAQSVSVITRKQIEELNPRDLSELFRLMPGVDVFSKAVDDFDVSAYGLNKELSNQMLVLIDGKPVMNALYGHTWWREVPIVMDSIERVEVVKGPGSAQWGANAFAGLNNIVTDHGSPRTREGTRATLRAGERRYFGETVRVADWKKDGGFTLTLDHRQSDGPVPLTRVTDEPNRGFNLIQHDSRKFAGVADFEKVWGNDTKLSLRFSEARGSTEDPGSFVRFNDRRTAQTDIKANYAYGEVLHRLSNHRAVSFKVQSNTARNTFGRQPYYDLNLNPLLTQEDSFVDFDLQGRSDLRDTRYIYGLTFRNTVSKGPLMEDCAKSIQTKSAYVQMEHEFDKKTQGFLGLILYDSSMTGFAYSPKLSILRELGRDQVLRFGWGKAFRAPDVVAFFFTGFKNMPSTVLGLPAALGYGTFRPAPLFAGNPGLDNEEIQQVDIGYEKRTDRDLIKFDAWYSESENLIAPVRGSRGIPIGLKFAALPAAISVPGFNVAGWFVNLPGTLYSKGFTFEVGHTFSREFRLDANLTYQDLHMADFFQHQNLPNSIHPTAPFAPHLKTNLIARYSPTHQDTVTGVLHTSASYPSSGIERIMEVTTLPSFSTVDLSWLHRFKKHPDTSFSLAGKNLFNDVHHEFIRRLDLLRSTEYGGIELDRQWIATVSHAF